VHPLDNWSGGPEPRKLRRSNVALLKFFFNEPRTCNTVSIGEDLQMDASPFGQLPCNRSVFYGE
jgi:hypothetical protein